MERSLIFKSALFPLLCLSLVSYGQNNTTPYGKTTPDDIKQTMDRILVYVDGVTQPGIINRATGKSITDLKKPIAEATLAKTEYNMASHEWGLAYAAMLLSASETGDQRYKNYVAARFDFLASAAPYFREYKKSFPHEVNPLEHFLFPGSLDDTGSMCAALIQYVRSDGNKALQMEIEQSINFILAKIPRLADGTFCRNRPMPNSLWVDDLYQGIPALAQMGKLTGNQKYYDEGVKQVLLFMNHLFDPAKQVCLHGLVEDMSPHPTFYWARANGWAILAISALLDVLPAEHPKRTEVLKIFQSYCQGIARLQAGSGFWHQLMDRNDSFPETSATAMFTYAFAHGITQGWLDIRVYGSAALLGWNAVNTKVNAIGQVEGTSAGTSMAFDPAFYYQRPIGTGPHGYGSVLIAGAAMFKLLKEHAYEGNPVIFKK
jgi:unsaturated rhamnogalacturonyl hydrolase